MLSSTPHSSIDLWCVKGGILDLIYIITKHIHVWCVTLSFALFMLRAIWHSSGSDLLSRKLIRITQHAVDTLLLVSGVILVYRLYGSAELPQWLIVKLAMIALYITFGFIGFKVKQSLKLMVSLALLCFFTAAYLPISQPWP